MVVCTAVCTLLCNDAHRCTRLSNPACDENVHEMCELPNYGRVLVATAVMALWRCTRARVMDVLLGVMHCWRYTGITVCA